MVLYRKYRPQKLQDLIGQDHVKKTILAQLESGKTSHAYLFTGPKGTGKTTTARILAKAVNCTANRLTTNAKSKKASLSRSTLDVQQTFSEPCNQCSSCLAILKDANIDVMEIDAASTRGIDDIRNLRESIKLVPVTGRFKVYIVDEAHMLTNEAFNAFLKTLEEPPQHAIFILATTAPEKMPATIVSRCQVFNFFPATHAQITEVLEKIAKAEGRDLDNEFLTKIAAKSEGSYRDAVVLLEKILAQENLDEKTITELLTGVDFEVLTRFAQNLAEKNAKGSIVMLNDLVVQGVPAQVVNSEFTTFLRNLLFVKVGVHNSLDLQADNINALSKLAEKFTQGEILELIRLFEQAAAQKNSPVAQLPTELAIAQFCLPKDKE